MLALVNARLACDKVLWRWWYLLVVTHLPRRADETAS